MTERDIEMLENDQGEISAGGFYEFIVEHYLRKFIVSICIQHV